MKKLKREQTLLIPVPQNVSGENERIAIENHIVCDKKEWNDLINVFCKSFQKINGVEFTEGIGGIRIIFDEKLWKEEYCIKVDTEVKLYASSYEGASYGIASLLQLIDKDCTIPKLCIEDYPDKDYRGLMVDVARKWHPFGTLLHYVDLCFILKIKYLHLHFSDDQSFTLPSVAFPKLSDEGKSYTKQEIKVLREYAKQRGVVLIPEIEMPGHVTILNERYPEIFSNRLTKDDYHKTITENGTEIGAEAVLCAGSEKAFTAVLTLLDEVMELFPDSIYIHLGSDEANYHAWDTCTVCQQYMKDHGLKNSKELYADFIKRVTDYVLSCGKTPIVWEGFSDEDSHMISKNVVVIGWENHYQNVYDLIKNGFKVINCAWQPLYIVSGIYENERYHFEDILDWNVYEWQHWWKESEAALNPIRVQPTEQVLGAQICVWELTYEREIARTVENLAALSERSWSVLRVCDKYQFQDKAYKILDKIFLLIAEE